MGQRYSALSIPNKTGTIEQHPPSEVGLDL